MNLRSKLPNVGTTIFTVMTERARQLGAINLAQGFPDYEPPDALKQLLTEHVQRGPNQYAPMIGATALREQIALKLAASYGRMFDAEQEITITLGATEALFSSISALVHPGVVWWLEDRDTGEQSLPSSTTDRGAPQASGAVVQR